MDKEKSVDEMIVETENKIVAAINESNLNLAVIDLILKNVLSQVNSIRMQARQEVNNKTET